MKIIIDAMGGDHAPKEIVLGALQAAEEYKTEIVLVGRGEDVLNAMRAGGWDTLPAGVEVADAPDVVDMHADPTEVVKQHRTSSMVLGLKMLADGEGDAFISAGNTGALLTAATLVVKRIRGIRRAAFAPIMPIGSGSVLIDAGANAECTPEFLLQFGCMGSLYARKALHKPQPRVALLNNGTEDSKGDGLHKEAYRLLQEASGRGLLHFTGNIEARDVLNDKADVIVADGFSGNILLKAVEGTAQYMGRQIKGIFLRSPASKLGYVFCRRGVKALQEQMDYRKIGGSMLVGITKPVIKAHGSSDAVAICGAIRQAMDAVNSGFCDEIRANIASITDARQEAGHVSEA